VEIFTIGYAGKSAEAFFEVIKANRIDVLLDIRLWNTSQLAGFTKKWDLQYFLRQICDCDYVWASQFAPTPALLDNYKSGNIDWSEYEKIYNDLLNTRNNLEFFKDFHGKRVCLLCAEAMPERCHRRLLAERVTETHKSVCLIHL